MASPNGPTIYSCEGLIEAYTTRGVRPSKRVPRVSHTGFENLPAKTQKLVRTVLKEVRGKDLAELRKSFAKKLEFFLHLIGDSLKEAGCTDIKVQKDISTTRLGLLRALNGADVFTDEDMTCLRENGFSLADILHLARTMDTWKGYLQDPIAKLHQDVIELGANVDRYKHILGDGKYFSFIVKTPNGMEKLKMLIDFDSKYNQGDCMKLNGAHIQRILTLTEWKRRMEYLMDDQNGSYIQELKKAEFSGFQLTEILVNAKWEERLAYLKYAEKWERLIILGLRGVHLMKIILQDKWEEKLNYLTEDQNFKKLQRFNIDASGLTEIVLGDKWKRKLNYITNDENFKKLQRFNINPAHLREILLRNEWEKELRAFFSVSALAQPSKTH